MVSRPYDMQDEDFSPPQKIRYVHVEQMRDDGVFGWSRGYEHDYFRQHGERHEFIGKTVTIRVYQHRTWGDGHLNRGDALRAAKAACGYMQPGMIELRRDFE